MSRRGDVGIVVLAAGGASRYGVMKLTLPVDGVAMARRAAAAAAHASEHVAFVTGAQHELVAPLVADLAVAIVRNDEWSNGMGTSIARGVAHLCRPAPALSGLIIALADQVCVGAQEFAALIAVHAQMPQHIIAARYAGRLGAPCLFPRSCFEELSGLHGASGAHVLLERHADRVQAIAMPQAAADVDTPADYARLVVQPAGD